MDIEKIILVPSQGGVYDVEVNGTLLFTKQKIRRHARTGEIVELVRGVLQKEQDHDDD